MSKDALPVDLSAWLSSLLLPKYVNSAISTNELENGVIIGDIVKLLNP
jgi:hypothetical protein